MDSVGQEVEAKHPSVVWTVGQPVVFAMENKPVENVLSEGPEDSSGKKHRQDVERRVVAVECVYTPDTPDHVRDQTAGVLVHGSLADGFKEVVLEKEYITDGVNEVLWLIDKHNILVECELGVEHLPCEGLGVIKIQLVIKLVVKLSSVQ